jgi:hypothetical protein
LHHRLADDTSAVTDAAACIQQLTTVVDLGRVSVMAMTSQGQVRHAGFAAAREWLQMMIFEPGLFLTAASTCAHEGAAVAIALGDSAPDRGRDVARCLAPLATARGGRRRRRSSGSCNLSRGRLCGWCYLLGRCRPAATLGELAPLQLLHEQRQRLLADLREVAVRQATTHQGLGQEQQIATASAQRHLQPEALCR